MAIRMITPRMPEWSDVPWDEARERFGNPTHKVTDHHGTVVDVPSLGLLGHDDAFFYFTLWGNPNQLRIAKNDEPEPIQGEESKENR